MSKEQLMLDVDQAGELKAMFRREGWTNKDIKALCEKKGLGTLFLEVLEGRSEIKPVEYLIDLDTDPFIPEGWRVKEHKKGGQWKYDSTKVGLYLSEKQLCGKIGGYDLLKELESQPVMNANMLEFYLKNTYLIPSEWKGKAIIFWGTIYCFTDGDFCVRYLHWNGKSWHWFYFWLSLNFDDYYTAVVLNK
ncbi:MAG: hypothetical protein PHN69_01210 [Candidatus Pacebacteria bacterium]|nr:hypothetical protein [Candidatus Paceibacterota bacterium]